MKAKHPVPALRGGNPTVWLPTELVRSNFVAARLDETENQPRRAGNLGNVG
jgi:hypothetical protein